MVQGYLNYHAVPGNLKRLGMFRAEVCRAWMHALRRRSQRTRMTWDRFSLWLPATSRKSASAILTPTSASRQTQGRSRMR